MFIVNSQVTFDEFHLMYMKKVAYEATYNPQIVHEYGLYDLSPDDPNYESMSPEALV